MVTMIVDELCEELVEEILSRVPLKPLTKMKCVSKDWCRLISQLTKSIPRLNPFGLIWFSEYSICFNYNGVYGQHRSNLMLLNVQVQEGKLEYHESCSTLLDGNLDSLCYSDGLLLCCESETRTFEPILYDLILKQLIHLPPVDEFLPEDVEPIGMGLALDDKCLTTRHFKLVCFYYSGCLDFFDCVIYSSETREWKKLRAPVSNYSSINYNGETGMVFGYPSNIELFFQSHCLYHEGLIYWTVHGYLVVYHPKDNFFEIHDLPMKKYWDMDECLWMSNGCLHYSCIDWEFLSVWNCVKGVEIDSNDEYHQNENNRMNTGWWMLKHKVDIKTLKVPEYPEFLLGQPYDLRIHKPCAFDEDFEILYFLIIDLGLVLSYSFETGCLRKVKKLEYA
ncbi:hypothetical protein FRX31_027930 [Thalictrum thalictroides]|uniref:F-box domain-containing protein n=1 Tax=Thalictrum thalictroides TaxID=46969 RepID=A0A7J6VBN2_THATH|nr:hypothetical protein FRX31_027930 [Thalictrum thalictroides]